MLESSPTSMYAAVLRSVCSLHSPPFCGLCKRSNKQRQFYSGKKRRHTFKTQVIVDKKTKQVICTTFANGKRHDFRIFKESKTKINPDIKVITNTGYQGIQTLHSKAELPKKKTKKNPLTKKEKQKNQALASERVPNDNVIGMLKRFKIISDKYRNRRKRFCLRFNLNFRYLQYRVSVITSYARGLLHRVSDREARKTDPWHTTFKNTTHEGREHKTPSMICQNIRIFSHR